MDAPQAHRAQQTFERAFAMHRDGRAGEALAAYDDVLRDDPRHAPALHYSALVLHQARRTPEAIARLRESLAIDATVADVWCNAGLIYGEIGRHADAAFALEEAVLREPSLATAWIHLSSQRLAMDDPPRAEAAARRAAALPDAPAAPFALALALAAQGRRDEALAALDATSGAPDGAVAAAGLRAQLLVDAGRLDEARLALDRVLATHDDPFLRLERARLAEARGDLAAAAADHDAVLATGVGDDASHEMALSESIFLKKRSIDWSTLAERQAEFRWRVEWHRKAGDASTLSPFSLLSDPSTRAEQRACGESWSRRFGTAPLASRFLSKGRLRVGYLSSDLHQHATGILAAGLFEHHDRQRFEVFAYSTGPDDGSALRRRLVAGFEHFVDARGWPALRVARRIAADGIDVLVDLKGHTERAPTEVVALRPAPIAVSYLGYPGTTGSTFVDYVIGDRIVTPLAHGEDYSETIVQLPASYQVNDDRRAIGVAPTRTEVGLPGDAVVLCCFNGLWKINADVLGAWAEILARVPDAVLWLQTRGGDDAVRARLVAELAARGVASSRVVFAASRPHADYVALYRLADLFLDTWPYGAHTTASDALWAGCPLVTLLGETFAGRVGASLLTAVGLNAWIAPDRANYVATAAAWAGDRQRLAALRARLERDARASPLFDTAATTRAIESAYLEMARQYGAGRRAPILVAADGTVAR